MAPVAPTDVAAPAGLGACLRPWKAPKRTVRPAAPRSQTRISNKSPDRAQSPIHGPGRTATPGAVAAAPSCHSIARSISLNLHEQTSKTNQHELHTQHAHAARKQQRRRVGRGLSVRTEAKMLYVNRYEDRKPMVPIARKMPQVTRPM